MNNNLKCLGISFLAMVFVCVGFGLSKVIDNSLRPVFLKAFLGMFDLMLSTFMIILSGLFAILAVLI
jgi:hypothetical protein